MLLTALFRNSKIWVCSEFIYFVFIAITYFIIRCFNFYRFLQCYYILFFKIQSIFYLYPLWRVHVRRVRSLYMPDNLQHFLC